VFFGRPENWLVIPEANAKTTLVAGLALYHLEHRLGAEVLVAASSREQAEFLYKQADGFVYRTGELHDTFECLAGYREIRCAETGGRIKVFAADQRTGDGALPTMAIIEEAHRQKDMGLYRTWQGKLDKRDGQIVLISTAGEPFSEFENARELMRLSATQSQRGETFGRFVSTRSVMHEWCVPEGADTDDLDLVKRANPLKALTKAKLAAKRASPSYHKAHWDRMVCGRPTRGGGAAISEADWAAAVSNERIPEGKPIWLGMDVAWKYDCTALVPYYQPRKDFRLFGTPTVLTPPRDGNSLDPNEIERALFTIHKRNPIAVLVMDPSKAEQLAEWARQNLGCKVIERKQTNAYAEIDYARFVEALGNHWLKHPGDYTFNRHVLNAIARITPYGAARFDRTSSSREGDQDARVIDALSAAAMVHAAANEENPDDEKPKWRLLA
jgi:phage terminase large subunit-like protein